MIWNSESLEIALGVKVTKNIEAEEVQFNSMNIKEGDIFIALNEGEGDGHDYVQDALLRQAACAIVSRIPEGISKKKLIVVDDTYQALLKLASYKRKISKAKFIAITGSVGKTTTKELVFTILSAFGKTFASRETYNNYIGVPLNLASMPDNIEYAVIEIGMNHKDEIIPLTKMVMPHIALITNVAQVHSEYFDSLDSIADAKSEIFEGLNKNGIAVIPINNRLLANLQTKGIQYIHTFGENKEADSKLKEYSYKNHTSYIELEIEDNEINFTTKLGGKYNAINISAALLIAKILDLDLNKAVASIRDFEAVLGRGKILNISKFRKEFAVIYDCYNASPIAIQASLVHMKDIPAKSKVAVLADMKELGGKAIEYHLSLIPFILDTNIHTLITVGPLMKNLHDQIKGIKKYHFETSDDLKNKIQDFINNDDLILFKGSKSMKLSSIVEYLYE